VTAPTIEVRELACASATVIFRQLSFDIPGWPVGVAAGASGAGKTSLLRIIAGLAAPPRSGSPATAAAGPASGVDGAKDLLYPWLSVRDNVALGARLRGERVDRQRVATLLEQVGLSHCADDRPASLSGGMRQRRRWRARCMKIGPSC
jgi:putative hydroxymethylpyrimidine transport system ATP-binding protein